MRDKYHGGAGGWSVSSLAASVNVRQTLVLLIANLLAFTAVSLLLSSSQHSGLSTARLPAEPLAADSSVLAAVSALQDNVAALQLHLQQQQQRGGVAVSAAASAGRPNAIVGMAANVAFEYLYHFVRSAREACRACVVLLYMPQKDVTERVQSLLSYWSAEVFVYDALLASYTAKQQSFHPSSTRWLMMYDRMAQATAAERYNALFLTDVRDTVFQSDPFTAIMTEGEGWYVAMENGLVSIA